MTPGEILVLLLINTSIPTSVLRQLGFEISRAAWEKKRKLHAGTASCMCACEYSTTWRQAAFICTGRRLFPLWLHRALVLIAKLTTPSLCSLCLASAVGVTLRSASLPLTAWGAACEEVSGHLALPLHLHNATTFQLVSIADQHVM